jgi:26S proteasome regulatory subunit N6
MKAIADSYKERSIEKFQLVYKKYTAQLAYDDTVKQNLSQLEDQLLENNLIRLLEPFNRVQITHVAELIQLPLSEVELKLSSMILDGKLNGILDQGAGDLILFDEQQQDQTFSNAIDTVKELNHVVDRLNRKAKRLVA